MRRGAGARGRQPPEVDREEEDQEEAHPERRQRQPEEREDLARAVPPLVDPHRRDDPGGDADQEREGHRRGGEQERVGQPGEVELEHRGPVVEGVAEVAAQPGSRRSGRTAPRAGGRGRTACGSASMSAWLAPGSTRRTAGSPVSAHEQEDGDGQQHERDQRVADPLDDVALHLRPPGTASSAERHLLCARHRELGGVTAGRASAWSSPILLSREKGWGRPDTVWNGS